MKKRFLILTGIISLFLLTGYSQELPGLRVIGRNLYDKCGEKIILRGISNPNIWFEKDGGIRYSEIEQTGANVIRIVWDTNGSPTDLELAIENCIALNMIPMIELHDATGDWSKLQQCVDYWCRSDIATVIQTYEEFLMVNIANEVGNGNVTKTTFRNDYAKHVSAMRDAGIHVPLVIDGTSWGQNISILQSEGPALIEADPDHNLMFSVHMWWPKMYGFTENSIVTGIAQSVKMELPLIVGEFSQMHGQCTDKTITEDNKIVYQTILRECQKNQVGYIAWSWFGNCNSLWDMSTNGTFATLYSWGLDVAVTNENSIKNTSVRPYSIQFGKCNPTADVENFLSNENKKFELNNFPNPFSDKTFIHFQLHQDAAIEISVFNTMGEKVYFNKQPNALKGKYAVPFDATGLQSGIYFCSIRSGNSQETKKMVIIK
jgi:mannan endo-1,4-beta-mannosidase